MTQDELIYHKIKVKMMPLHHVVCVLLLLLRLRTPAAVLLLLSSRRDEKKKHKHRVLKINNMKCSMSQITCAALMKVLRDIFRVGAETRFLF